MEHKKGFYELSHTHQALHAQYCVSHGERSGCTHYHSTLEKKKRRSDLFIFRSITIVLGGAEPRMQLCGEVNPCIKMIKSLQQLLACLLSYD